MLHDKSVTSSTHKNNQPLWTQDEAIAYECAREVINDMVGIYSYLINQEENKANPDVERIHQLDARITELFNRA